MNGSRRLAAALGVVALTLGCGEPPPPADAVARFGDEAVAWQAFREYLLENGVDATNGLEDEVLSRLLDHFLSEELLRRLTVDEGWAEPGVGRREALEAALRHQPAPAPADEAVRAYYEAHSSEFDLPERVHLQQILVEDRQTADELADELARGAEFSELARSYSLDPSGPAGGDQGVLARSELPPYLAERIFALAVGEVSDVVEADYGFHLFRVVSRQPAERLTFDEAREEIRRRLARQSTDRQLADLLREASSRYNPEILRGNLPFEYLEEAP